MVATLERIADPKDFIFDPYLKLYLPLYELDGASFMSRDAYGHLCTVTGAFWTPRGYSFDGGRDYINAGSHSVFTLGTLDWTFEFWVYASALVDDAIIMATATGKKNVALSGVAGAIKISIEGATDWVSNTGLVDAEQWTYFAITKQGDVGTIFKDGNIFQTSATAFSGANNTTSEALCIGYHN